MKVDEVEPADQMTPIPAEGGGDTLFDIAGSLLSERLKMALRFLRPERAAFARYLEELAVELAKDAEKEADDVIGV